RGHRRELPVENRRISQSRRRWSCATMTRFGARCLGRKMQSNDFGCSALTMLFRELLGKFVTLTIDRFIPAGALLTEGKQSGVDPAALLLPKAEVPQGAHEGDSFEVFVYLDSMDRPIATTRTPKIGLGEVGFLEVKDLNDVGAFVDWGLVKQLFVPFREQTVGLRIGHRYPIGVYLDSSDRLAGTMRIREMLADHGDFALEEWVDGEIWRFEEGVGTFVILEHAYFGLIPAYEHVTAQRGDAVKARVVDILADGKIELSLRRKAHEEAASDASRVLEVLSKAGVAKGDNAGPEEIRTLYGISKKAFKRAVGMLLRQRLVRIRDDGNLELVEQRSKVLPSASVEEQNASPRREVKKTTSTKRPKPGKR
ncbi:MAG: S1-like domain-containing RNA-binding protein, partial [Polyangiaceae bacterium]